MLLGPLGPEEQPKVTLIGCTTDAGRLPEAILDRFKLQPDLEDYSDAQAADIALIMCDRVFTGLTPPSRANCAAIAMAANNNPRRIKALLETLRDIVLVTEAKWTKARGYDLTELFDNFGLTRDGLTPTAQQYLMTLYSDFAGEPAGAAAMKDRLQEPGGLDLVERVLMHKGLIAKTKTGRTLTQPGIRRARRLVDDGVATAARATGKNGQQP